MKNYTQTRTHYMYAYIQLLAIISVCLVETATHTSLYFSIKQVFSEVCCHVDDRIIESSQRPVDTHPHKYIHVHTL